MLCKVQCAVVLSRVEDSKLLNNLTVKPLWSLLVMAPELLLLLLDGRRVKRWVRRLRDGVCITVKGDNS